jgi:FlaA1/EpsC-like NDP-sugar epimerase
MDNEFFIFLPIIILLLLFIIYVWRRHSLKNFDWATLICIALGVCLLTIVIMLILNSRPDMGSERFLLIAIPVVMLILFLLFLTRIVTVEKMKSKLHMDERITIINAKSARNALVAVFLSSAIYLLIYPNISNTILLGILAASLIVYLASMVIYYYRDF